MNKEVIIIGGGLAGGMVSNGMSALLPQSESPLLNFAIAGVSVFGATKVSGSTTKDHLLKGALLGSAIVQGLTGLRKFADKHLSDKLTGEGKISQFARGSVGLACPCEEGLNGSFMGADGQVYEYDETGLHGTVMDEAGNVFEVEDGLQGVLDEIYDDGLHGAEEMIYGEEDETGLHGVEETLYDEIY